MASTTALRDTSGAAPSAEVAAEQARVREVAAASVQMVTSGELWSYLWPSLVVLGILGITLTALLRAMERWTAPWTATNAD